MPVCYALEVSDAPTSGRLNFTTHMHDSTAAAVRALVEALKAHPEDLLAMRPYGDLPQHLIDFIEDHEDDLTQDLT